MVKQTRNRANVYQVNLSEGEVERLESMTRKGTLKAREMKRAQVLLMSYRQKNDAEICEALGTSTITVKRLRRTFVEQGLDAVLYDAPRSGRPSIYSGEDRAKITVLACSEPPEGHEKWSVRLLADKAVELNLVDTMSPTTVHVILKKTNSHRI